MAAMTAELDWMATQLQTIGTYIDVAGPEALSLPQTILSPNGWPSSRHTQGESCASQSHLSAIWGRSDLHHVGTRR